MTRWRRLGIHKLVTILLLALLLGAAPSLRQAKWDFETNEAGKIAAGFTSHSGRWEVVKVGDNHVLAQLAENRVNVVNVTLVEQSSDKNIDLSVRIKSIAGENERGGGLIWRAKDKDNFYAVRHNPYSVRFNPRPPNIRLYKMEEGKLTQLDHAEIVGDDDWHSLRITMNGSEIVGYLDDKKLLEAEDSTFLDVGKIGLWSRSDAQSYFDDLTISSFRAPEIQP